MATQEEDVIGRYSTGGPLTEEDKRRRELVKRMRVREPDEEDQETRPPRTRQDSMLDRLRQFREGPDQEGGEAEQDSMLNRLQEFREGPYGGPVEEMPEPTPEDEGGFELGDVADFAVESARKVADFFSDPERGEDVDQGFAEAPWHTRGQPRDAQPPIPPVSLPADLARQIGPLPPEDRAPSRDVEAPFELAGKLVESGYELGKTLFTTKHPEQFDRPRHRQIIQSLGEGFFQQPAIGAGDFVLAMAEGGAELLGAEDIAGEVSELRESLPPPTTRAGQISRFVGALGMWGKTLKVGSKAFGSLQSAVGTSIAAGRGTLAAGERIAQVPGWIQAVNTGATATAIGALRSESGESSAAALAEYADTPEGRETLELLGVDDPTGVAESLHEIANTPEDRRLFDSLLEGGLIFALDASFRGLSRLMRSTEGIYGGQAPGEGPATPGSTSPAPGAPGVPSGRTRPPARPDAPGQQGLRPTPPGPERPGDIRLPDRRPGIEPVRREIAAAGRAALPAPRRGLPAPEAEGAPRGGAEEPASMAERLQRFREMEPQEREQFVAEVRELEQAAHRDPLTGALNRRGGIRAMERRAQPENTVRVELDADMDNFKAINDNLGHDAGDRALQIVSREIESATRGADEIVGDPVAIVRQGGDEFRVVLDVPQGMEVQPIARRIESQVNDALAEEGLAEAGGKEVGLSLGRDVYTRKAERGVSQPRTKPEGAPDWGEGPPTMQHAQEGPRGERPPRNTFSLPRESIGYAPEVFQYKVAGPQAEGEALLGRERWSDLGAGTIKVWYWEDPGTHGFPEYEPGWYVVDGHNRLRFAEELAQQGRPSAPDRLNVMEIQADSPAKARAIGARLNLMADRGTPIDAAKYFRDANMTPADVAAEGIGLTEAKTQKGLALAQLPEPIFRDVATGRFPMNRAVIIGESGLEEDLMVEVWKYAKEQGRRALPDSDLGEFIQQMKATPAVTEQEATLFGVEEMKRSLMKEKSQVVRYVKNEISKDRRLMEYVTRAGRAERLEETGAGEIEQPTAEEIGKAAAQFEAQFHARAYRKGPVGEVVNKYARQLAEGNRPANEIKQAARDEIESVLKDEVRSGGREGDPDAGPVGRDRAGEGPPPEQGGFFEGTEPGEAGGLGEAGFLKIPLDKRSYTVMADRIQKATDVSKSVLKRHFTVAGDLPEPVFSRKIQRDTWLQAENQEVQYILRDFENGVRKITGKKVDPRSALSESQLRHINEALHGERQISELPDPIRGPVQRMRDQIDAYSNRLIDIGAVQGEMAATVAENLGVYMNRSYRVFDMPKKWRESVPEDVWNKAYSTLRQEIAEQNPGMTEQELHERTTGLMDHLLAPDADGPLQFFASGQLGKKDLSILTRRKDIAPEIRALMGEYKDPIANYVRTTAKQMHLVANHELLVDVLEEGLGHYFHTAPVRKGGISYSHKIAAEGSKVMEPLNGLYTTEEIATAFKRAVDSGISSTLWRRYMKANAAVKAGKTVGGPVTHARNFVANIGFVIAGGTNPLSGGKKAMSAVTANFNLAERLAERFGGDVQAAREYYQELQRLGVVSESARFGELQDIMDDATKRGIESYMRDPQATSTVRRTGERAVGVGLRAAQSLYRIEDDFWKIVRYESELAKWREVYKDDPGWSDQRIKEHAAQIVRNTMPTYSLVPQSVKYLRRLPMVGTFPSFTAEVFRVSKNMMKLTAEELGSGNPKVRKIGAQRLAGMIAMALAIPAATAAGRFMLGINRDDDDRVRRFMPPWSRYSNILYLGRDDEGNIRYVDLSYTDPFADLRRPLMALMTGGDWETALLKSTWQTMEPFLGPEILWDAWNDIVYNTERETGRRIYNPAADPHDQMFDMMDYGFKKVQPGFVAQMRRIANATQDNQLEVGRVYDLSDELLATVMGIRISRFDPQQALSFKARDRQGQLGQAQRILNSVFARRGDVDRNELEDAYREMEEARQHYWKEAYRDVQAIKELGLTTRQIQSILVNADFSQDQARMLLQGRYEPYMPSEQFITSLRESFIEAGGRQAAREVNERRDVLRGLHEDLRGKLQTVDDLGSR